MRGGKIFLDTNVLVYAHDASSGRKYDVALKTVLELWESGRGLLSTQVLQEFFYSVTRKIPKPMEVGTARQVVEDMLRWDVVVTNGDSLLAAIDIQTRYRYSFWDSMIVQSAIHGGADILLSEDLSDGQKIQGIEIKNPFR